MKRLIAALLIILAMISIVGCGEKGLQTPQDQEEVNSSVTDTENNDAEKEETSDSEWREFLKEYEEWVDDYIEIVKKYKENPADLSILTDYTEMVGKLGDWSSRSDEIAKELSKKPSEAAEYAAELAKIAAKLAQAV